MAEAIRVSETIFNFVLLSMKTSVSLFLYLNILHFWTFVRFLCEVKLSRKFIISEKTFVLMFVAVNVSIEFLLSYYFISTRDKKVYMLNFFELKAIMIFK